MITVVSPSRRSRSSSTLSLSWIPICRSQIQLYNNHFLLHKCCFSSGFSEFEWGLNGRSSIAPIGRLHLHWVHLVVWNSQEPPKQSFEEFWFRELGRLTTARSFLEFEGMPVVTVLILRVLVLLSRRLNFLCVSWPRPSHSTFGLFSSSCTD